jgi:hypothetical protein
MEWLMFLSQLPATPSSLRVQVWRKLRSAGALGLQNGVWILPNKADKAGFLEELLEAIKGQGASGQIFTVLPVNEMVERDILSRFQTDRQEEYTELIERSQEFLAEIEKESSRSKFTFAELEENEQDLQRLYGWLEKIHKRDFMPGEIASQANEVLKKCRESLEEFAKRVYAEQASFKDNITQDQSQSGPE